MDARIGNKFWMLREMNGAPAGNDYWKLRKTHGAPKRFEDPDALWAACCEYFEWVEANPLIEMRPFAYQGEVIQEPVPKMRAMTFMGLCLFLGIDRGSWLAWRKRDDLKEVVEHVDMVIYTQKFTGAAADLLNPVIISRDLGLADKQDHSSTDGSMSPGPTRIEIVAPSVQPKRDE